MEIKCAAPVCRVQKPEVKKYPNNKESEHRKEIEKTSGDKVCKLN